MTDSTIDSVVFDVGRVLVDFGYHDLFPFLREHGAIFSGTDDFIEHCRLLDYEHGRISSREFLGRIEAMLERPPAIGELERRWCDIFAPIDEMTSLATALKASVRVYLLSNTGELHWAHLQSAYRLFDCAHGAIASFEVNAMKPDARIYEAARERFRLTPGRTVFIDDIAANVEGAIRCGWHGIHHTGPESTKAALRELGLGGF